MSETMAGLQNLINEQGMPPQPSPPSGAANRAILSSTLPALGGESDDEQVRASVSPEQDVASNLAQVGQLFTTGDIRESSFGLARSLGEGLINQQVSDWLGQKGTVQASLGTNRMMTGDLLLPLVETDHHLLFSQLGLHSNQDRNIANFGVGYRHYRHDWMFGVNTFYDYDYTGKNARLGLGGEVGTGYMKLGVNAYYPLTAWHPSSLDSMNMYDERPAKGVDMRLEGWLPSLPQLGAKVKYERYFGKHIALRSGGGLSHLKDDAQALTLGLSYMPFPLVTFSGERSVGDNRDTRLDLALNYRLGVPLWRQLESAGVDFQRSLSGSKYSLVDRNNDIVMQYRKQTLIGISLPRQLIAEAGAILRIPVTVTQAKYGLARIEWSASANFTANGGNWRQPAATELEVQVPAYVSHLSRALSAPQEYILTGVGIDKNGNRAAPASTIIRVMPSGEVIQPLAVLPGMAQLADKQHAFSVRAQVVDEQGQPQASQRVTFNVSRLTDSSGISAATLFADGMVDNNALSVETDNQGIAVVNVRSGVAGEGLITASLRNGHARKATVSFIADSTTARLSDFVIVTDNALADGAQANVLRATVRDLYGNPLENYAVDFSIDNDAVAQGGNTAMSDRNGVATLLLTHTRATTSTVIAHANNTTLSHTVNFVADRSTARFAQSSITQDATADGVDSNILRVNVADARGNPLSGVSIQFSPELPVNVTPAQVITDAQGVAQTSLTSRRAGQFATVAKMVETGQTVQLNSRFVADQNAIQLTNESLIIAPDNAVANGLARNGVTVMVVDANDNPLPGVAVGFSVSAGATLAAMSDFTGMDGKAQTTVVSERAGVYTVSATVNGSTLNKTAVFVADVTTAQITTANLVVESEGAAANGIATNSVSATVTDAHGNALAGIAVDFAVSTGAMLTVVRGISDINGKAMAKATSLHAGIYTVTATVAGTSASKTMHFVGDVATASLVSVYLEGADVDKVANSTDAFTFKAVVKDVHDNPVSGATVKWRHDNGVAATISNLSVTDADGIASAMLQSTQMEATAINVSASLDGVTQLNADKTVSFNTPLVTLSGVAWALKSEWGSARQVLLPGVVVKLFNAKGDAQPVYSATTSSNGSYRLNVRPGRYYVEATSKAYLAQSLTLDVPNVVSYALDVTLTHRLEGASARISLTWDATPRNLDAHIVVPPPSTNPGGQRIHVYNASKAPANADAFLNQDVEKGYGPEIMIIKRMHPGAYCYSVNNHRPDLGPLMVGAKVKVELPDGRAYTWAVENASGAPSDLLWHVFKINVDQNGDAAIQPVNKIVPGSTFNYDGC